MKGIALSADDTVPLDAVATGVVGLRLLFVNVFGVISHDGWTLIDAGLQGSSSRIREWAKTHFSGPPEAIVLTHAHFDHIGALNGLLDDWDVPVYAHRDELPYLTGEFSYPPPDPSVGGGLMARLSGLFPQGPFAVKQNLRELTDGGIIPFLPEWRWLHTPGHTAGHISLFRRADRTLIVGDAFCTTKQESLLAVATQKPEVHGPPAYFTTDWAAARSSVEQLAALKPAFIAPGHGQPMAGADAAGALAQLASDFEHAGMPDKGRYVSRPTRG